MDEEIGESEMEEMLPEWRWRTDKGSWFQRHSEAYRKERAVILREDDVGGGARVTEGEERVLRGHEVMKVWRLGNCENFVGKREELVFHALIDFEPMERA